MVASKKSPRGLAASEKTAARAMQMMKRRMPIMVKGLGKPELDTLSVKEMSEVRVDSERYQRNRNVAEVNELIHVLRGGGEVPDPVTLARRPDGTLWVVDGQQRFWAHFETETPMRCLIYDVPNIEAERMLFVVMNSQKVVNAHVKVHAWPGPVATLLRTINDDESSPFFGRINFGQHTNRRYHAGPLIRAVFTAMTNLTPDGFPINDLLRRADVAWNGSADARDRARSFLQLVAKVFERDPDGETVGGRGVAKAMPMVALAQVAYAKWAAGKIMMPTEHQINRIRAINWDTLVPSNAIRFVPVVRGEIERRWRP